MSNKRMILILVLFAAALVYFGYLLPSQHGVQPGDEAPIFALPDQEGKVVRLSDFRGQTVLLNIWATWCPPCVWEMPSLNHLHKILAADNFKVLALSVDEGGWPVILQFMNRVPLSFPVLWDAKTEVAGFYGTYQLPESYLIGPNGKVLKKYMGPQEWDREDVIAEIKALMKQNAKQSS